MRLFNFIKNFKFKWSKASRGVSLAEALAAIAVSTAVMGASYTIYNQFQGTFVRQINHNNLKQEARFALFTLQFDARMAGYKHPDSTLGEVEIPVKVLNDDGSEVTDDTEFGEKIYFCFDTENSSGVVQRKLFMYEVQNAFSDSPTKTILKKKIFQSNSCDPADTDNTLVSDWIPLSQYFDFFGIRLRSKHVDYEIRMKTPNGLITETFTASAFMRNLNFGGKNYYVKDEDDLHAARTPVLPFTGSMILRCPNNVNLDIQLPSFSTDQNLFVLHQGETVGTTNLYRTFPAIRIETEKPPEITGIPSLNNDEMRLRATTSSTLPPGLNAYSGWTDTDEDGNKDSNENYDGSLVIEGTLTSTDTGYTFNSDGYQDFVVRVKSDLDTNCQGDGWNNQNEVYKDYTIRVMKFSAPQFSDINLFTWKARGKTFGVDNYESRGTRSLNGGPNFDITSDGRAYYIQQNLASPAFLVSNEDYDSFVLKGMICSGGYPDCQSNMTAWGDDDMLGFAAGLTRPNIPYKVWPDGRIRACAGVDYLTIKDEIPFYGSALAGSLRSTERNAYNAMTDEEKQAFWGGPNDNVLDMYLWSWWGAESNRNQSSIVVHHFNEYEAIHNRACGKSQSSYHSSSSYDPYVLGWVQPNSATQTYLETEGYDRLFIRSDSTRPNNTGTRRCWGKTNSFSRISYLPGATHRSNCNQGRNYGVKNIVTLTYNPKKFKAIVDNKPIVQGSDSLRFNAFDLRFVNGVLKNYLSSNFPYPQMNTGANITLPTATDAADGLKATSFQRFQKGAVALVAFSQPDNRYSNIQLARLPRFVPLETASNAPDPKSQSLYYYMDETYRSINKIYGLLSKSYDPVGNHLEVLVSANSGSGNCSAIGGRGTAESGTYKQETVDGINRIMNCRLSGTWRARTETWASNSQLPNIGEFYDVNLKASYSGARATITTTQGGTIQVFADGSFQYTTLPTGFTDDAPKQDSFYYAVQTEDTGNTRISNVKKVYIGWKIGNTTPTGVSYKEEDGTSITDLQNVDIEELDLKEKVVAELYASSTNEPDTHDFVRFNLGRLPDDHPDKDVDHGDRFRIDQKDDKFFLVLNNASSIRWSSLPQDKKFFTFRLIGTDLRGNQLITDQKVYVKRDDCSETAMENVKVYKTKAAMTVEGFIQGENGEKIYRRQTVPLTSGLDEAVIRFDYPARNVQPSIRVAEETVTVDGEEGIIGMLSNRCKDSHSFINRQQLWSNK